MGSSLVGAQVDRLAAVVALGGQHDALGGVVDVEELAAGRAGAPHLDVVGAGLLGVDAFLISAGITWDTAGWNLSPGPYRLVGIR